MKIFNKMFKKVSVIILAVAFMFSFTGSDFVFAAPPLATAPTTLGVATNYSVYSDAGVTNTGAGTRVWGNVGDNGIGHPGLTAVQVPDGTIGTGTGVAAAVGIAYGELAPQGAGGQILDLAVGIPGAIITPGVYNVQVTTLNGTLTLDGPGVYLFSSTSSISTSSDGLARLNLINGATACNVYWQIPISMTIGTNAHIEGTIIASTGDVTLDTGATLKGRAFAHTQITLDTNQITNPTCTRANDSSTSVQLQPPLINVTKIPNPLALPEGPGSVTYTYTVTNIGPVPMNYVWVRDDKCTPVEFISGDSNNDSILDLNETWIYRCTKLVFSTETNIATAHGSTGNGEVYNTASATIVVGVPSTNTVTPTIQVNNFTATNSSPVAVPKLPKTGFSPRETNTPWNYFVDIFKGLWNISSH